jgi:hypothetical protein
MQQAAGELNGRIVRFGTAGGPRIHLALCSHTIADQAVRNTTEPFSVLGMDDFQIR